VTIRFHYAKKQHVQMTKNTYMSRLFHKCPKFFKPGSVCVYIYNMV